MTMQTALEIFTNPTDLQLGVSQDTISGKFAILISRGPGHDFKLLLSSQAVIEKREEAVTTIITTLTTAYTASMQNREQTPEGALSLDCIGRISDAFKDQDFVNTWELFAQAA